MRFADVAALAIFCLVIALVVLLVLVPVTVQLPKWTKVKQRVPVHYSGVPILGVLLMLACGSLDGSTLAAGIIGDANLKPYGIVILFMALAYISTSLDMTGCFGWLALHITRRSKGNGPLLFLLYFAVSSSITVFTSNDISIMTLTPIIYYFSAATSTDAVPFLTAMFTAANIWSMLLFVGNPTNIIVAVAYQMSFADYTKWMALPTLGAGLSCLAVLLLVHARRIPRHLTLPAIEPSVLLMDTPGAVLGSLNIIGCLGLLAAAPSLGWELWPVTLVCAGLHAMYNFVAYKICKGRWCRQLPRAATAGAADCADLAACAPCVTVEAAQEGVAAAAAGTAEGKEWQQHGSEPGGGMHQLLTAPKQQQQELIAHALGKEPVQQQHQYVNQQQQQQQLIVTAVGDQATQQKVDCKDVRHHQEQQSMATALSSQVTQQQVEDTRLQQQQQHPLVASVLGSLAKQVEVGYADLLQQQQAMQPQQHPVPHGPTSSFAASCRCTPALWTPQEAPSVPAASSQRVPAAAATPAGIAGDQKALQLAAPARWPAAAAVAVHQSASDVDIQVSIHQQPYDSQSAAKQPSICSTSSRSQDSSSTTSAAAPKQDAKFPVPSAAGLLQELKQPSFGRVLLALPYEVVPFVLGMFILVEGLNATGWVDRLAWWLGSGVQGSVWAALFAVGSFSVLLANLANNQPCTILMTRVCMSPVFAQAAAAASATGAAGVTMTNSTNSSSISKTDVLPSMSDLSEGSSRVPVASAFAVVIASNVAANYTVMGALAGIMFVNILQRKGLKTVGYATFSKLMLPSGVASTVVALTILGAEFVTWR